MLEVKDLNTFYGEFHVLKNVSLRVEDGQFVAIFGPNGHGKSTLLKTLCGLVKPSSGEIRLNNTDTAKLSTSKIVEMGLVYVPEMRNLFPEMTVLQNLKLGAYNRRARSEVKHNLEYVFELFPRLRERQKQLAATLSGGEAQMLALGRGLMSSARVLAIDEPSLGLAPNLVTQIFNKIKEINKTGISILLVEQTIAQVSKLVDYVYVIEDGQIAIEGQKEEILANEHVKNILMGA